MKRAPPPPPNRKNPPPPPSRAPRPPQAQLPTPTQESEPAADLGFSQEPQRPQKVEPNINTEVNLQDKSCAQQQDRTQSLARQEEPNIGQAVPFEQELGMPDNRDMKTLEEKSFPARTAVLPKVAPPIRGNVPGPKTRGIPPPPAAKSVVGLPITTETKQADKISNNEKVSQEKEQLRPQEEGERHVGISNEASIQPPQPKEVDVKNPIPVPIAKKTQVPALTKSSPKNKRPPAPTFKASVPNYAPIQEQSNINSQDSPLTQPHELNKISHQVSNDHAQSISTIQQNQRTDPEQVKTEPRVEEVKDTGSSSLLEKLKRLQKAKAEMTSQINVAQEEIKEDEKSGSIQFHALDPVKEDVQIKIAPAPTRPIKPQQKGPPISNKAPVPPSFTKKSPAITIPKPSIEQQPQASDLKQPQLIVTAPLPAPKQEPITLTQSPKVSVIINNPPKSPMLMEINSLLERYHSVKASYLSSLRELDDQVNFHRQQQEIEVEKINHLISELSKRNERIKELCQITTVVDSAVMEGSESAAV